MIKFLHVADLHLGLRITRFDEAARLKIGEARFEAIDNLRKAAVEHGVHFILVAGDLFDDHCVSHAVADRAFKVFEGRTITCPVFVIPGNHDPLTPGGVWDRKPWTSDWPTKNIRLLREPVPTEVPGLPVTIFPCPLRGRNSIDDPTGWVANHPRPDGDRTIRIGLAHGSLDLFPNLPPDDHLIPCDAAGRLGLDYLALGHWHKSFKLSSSDGIERTAYSGTHEPMRFPDADADSSSGWSPYTADRDTERFQDGGRGTAQLVTIDDAGAPPRISTIEIGRLRWVSENRDITARRFGELVSAYSGREGRELTLLRLTLTGVTDPECHKRIDEELKNIIARYCPGSCLIADDVLIEPAPERLNQVVGDGVLARVLGRLRQDGRSADERDRRVAEHALKLLYRIAWEGQAG